MFLLYGSLLGDYWERRCRRRLGVYQFELLRDFLSESLFALQLRLCSTSCLCESRLMQQWLVNDLLHRCCLLFNSLFCGCLHRYDRFSNGLILLGLLRLMPGDGARATASSILTLLRLRVRLEQITFSAFSDDCSFRSLYNDSPARPGLINIRCSFIFLLFTFRLCVLILLLLRKIYHEGLFGLDGREVGVIF